MTNEEGLLLNPGDKVVSTYSSNFNDVGDKYLLHPFVIKELCPKYQGEPVFDVVDNPHYTDFHCMWLEHCSDVMFEVYKILHNTRVKP